MILHDDATEEHEPYFAALAKIVSDGLDVAGYFFCPGDMMGDKPAMAAATAGLAGLFPRLDRQT